jgi:hypothetical protein
MISILRIFAKCIVFLALLFCFLVLFQHGPFGFVSGAKSEAEWLRSLLQNSGEVHNMEASEGTEKENSEAQP